MTAIQISLSQNPGLLHEADLLLFRGQGFIAWLIRTASRSKYTHAGMVSWWHDEPMCVEVKEFVGGHVMRKMIGCNYGWRHIWRSAVYFLPIIHCFQKPPNGDAPENPSESPYCSEAVSRAANATGVDPVPNLSNRQTLPGDLERSAVLNHEYRLAP